MMHHHAPFLIRDARLFDGHTVRPRTSVLVRDGVLAPGCTDADAEIVDGDGRTLLPGLIDAHTHALGVENLAQALRFGVTTELDMFADPPSMREIKRQAATRHDLADIRSAGTGATATDGHPHALLPAFPSIDNAAEASAFVADRVAEGSDYLKIIIEDGTSRRAHLPTLDEETVRALVDAAHRHGLLAVSHTTDQKAARQAVDAGVDGLAHLFVDTPPTPDFGRRVAAAAMFVVPTLAVINSGWGDPAGAAALRDDPRIRPWLDEESLALLGQGGYAPPDARQGPSYAAAALTQCHAAGVPVLAGTDAPNGLAHGASLHHELTLLVDAGLTPVEALTAATATPATLFGLTDRGRIAAGLRADLLLVEGDPTTDVTATRAIAAVWRDGVRLDRSV